MKQKISLYLLTAAALAQTVSSCNEAEPPAADDFLRIVGVADTASGRLKFMFTAEEEASGRIFSRSFDPRAPVQVSITDNMELLLSAYSPRKIKGLDVYANVGGYGQKLLLAHFDTVPPFAEYTARLPFVDADADLRTDSGRVVRVMANPHLSPSDIENLQIRSEDPYYKMFADIKTTWSVSFSNMRFGQYASQVYCRYPLKWGHCREAVAMSINSAWMFSTTEYEEKMRTLEGRIRDDNGNNVSPETLINQSRTRRSYAWAHVNQVGGMGATWLLGLVDDPFVGHYGDDNGECVTWFHEYGHGMGYGHNSNVISQDQHADSVSWRKACQELYVQMSREKKLPIYSRRFMHSRRDYAFYSSSNASWRNREFPDRVIEDPELDEYDGGLPSAETATE